MITIEFENETPLTLNPEYAFTENTVSLAGEISIDADASNGADMILKEATLPSGASGIGAAFEKPVREAEFDLDVGPAGAVAVGYDHLGQILFAEKMDPSLGKMRMAFNSDSAALSRVEMFQDPGQMVGAVGSSNLLDGALDLLDDLLGGLFGGGTTPILELDLNLMFDFVEADFNLTLSTLSRVSNFVPAYDRLSFDRSFDNVIEGSGVVDTTMGTEGDDLIDGNAGNDWLGGGSGADILNGGSGDDTLNGGAGTDVLNGGDGSDTADYSGEDGFVRADLRNGDNNLGNAAGDQYIDIENVIGTDFVDDLRGTSGANSIFGGLSGDALSGFGGDDNLEGNAGNDRLNGGNGADTLIGGAGKDYLRGDAGGDTLDGGAGFDFASYIHAKTAITVDRSDMTLNTGDASGDSFISVEGVRGSVFNDSVTGDSLNDWFLGEAGDDVLNGGAGDDELHGGVGDDTINGGAGDDRLFGQAGADTFDGGSGLDTVYFFGSAAVTIDLADGSLNTGDAAGDTYTNIDVFNGSQFGDVMSGGDLNDVFRGITGDDTMNGRGGEDFLRGGAGADVLHGGDDNDRVDGNSGNDTLNGGKGIDVMYGGGGADTFVFDTTDWRTDYVRDYEDGVDMLHIGRDDVSFDDLTITESARGTHIAHDGTSIFLNWVAASTIDEGDFIFG